MSKTVSKFAFTAGLVLALAFTFFCSEAHAADNDKRIIGTWVEVEADGSDGDKWVFNSDGTLTIGDRNQKRYGVAAGKLAIVNFIDRKTRSFDLSISTDGRTAIISTGGAYDCLLRKKN